MKRLIVKELTINRAEGVDSSDNLVYIGENAFVSGINLVVGPNGTGKSTTATCLQSVLFGDVSGRRFDAKYRMMVDDEIIDGVTAGGQNTALSSYIPPDLTRKVFVMSLEDLVKIGQTDAAKLVRSEVFGGVRFDTLVQHAGLTDKAQTKRRAKARNAAEKSRNDVGLQHAGFPGVEAQLKQTTHDLNELQRRSRLAGCVKTWSELGKAKLALETRERDATQFDSRINHLLEDDPSQLAALEETRRTFEKELDDARNELNAMTDSLTDGQLRASDVTQATDALRDCAEPEARMNQLKEERAGVDAQRRAVREHIGDLLSDERLDQALDDDPLDSIRDAVIRLRDAEASVEANRRYLDALQSDVTADNERLKTCEEGLNSLNAWLSFSDDPASAPHEGKLPVIAAVVCALLAVGVAFVTPWALLSLIPAALMLATTRRRTRSTDQQVNPQIAFQNQFKVTGLEEPTTWCRERVIPVARDLQREIGTLEAAQRAATATKDAVLRLKDSEKRADDHRKPLDAACARFDLTPKRTPEFLQRLVDTVNEWRALSIKITGIDGQIQEIDNTRDGILANLNHIFENALDKTAANRFEADALLGDLSRQSRLRERAKKLTITVIPSMTERLRTTLEQRLAVLKRLGLSDSDEPGQTIERWTGVSKDARTAFSRRDEAALQLKTANSNWLEAAATLTDAEREEVTTLSGDQLIARINDSSSVIEEVTVLSSQKRALDDTLDTLRQSDELDKAEANLHEADATFTNAREKDVANMIGRRMLELVRKRCQRHASPTLARAGELFKLFTNDHYTLEPSSLEDALMADAGGSKGVKSLDQLSSGTRVQMLMAARLAFLERKEADKGVRLPLFLDEVLCNSDDDRMTTILSTLLHIAKSRQIFYFTAQYDEIVKWKRMIDESDDDVTMKEIQLPLHGEGQMAACLHAPVEPPRGPAPEPGETWERYGERLGVAAMNPMVDALGDLHPWYLIHRPESLHDCLKNGIKKWAQFRNRYERLGTEGVLNAFPNVSEIELKRSIDLADCLEHVWKQWRIGRGKPVDRFTLERCGVKSSSYFEAVVTLAEEVCGDAPALITALEEKRIKGFRGGTLDVLKEDLEQLGSLTRQIPLANDRLCEEFDVYVGRHPDDSLPYLQSKRDWILSLFPSISPRTAHRVG